MRKNQTATAPAEPDAIPGAPVQSGQSEPDLGFNTVSIPDPTDPRIVALQSEAIARASAAVSPLVFDTQDEEEDPEAPSLSGRDALVAKFGEAAVAEIEAQTAHSMRAKFSEVAEMPAAIRDGLAADQERAAMQTAAIAGIPLEDLHLSSTTKKLLAGEKKHVIFCFNPDGQTFRREGSINGVEFSVPTMKAVSVPESIAERCVCNGWCQPPIAKTLEWQKHIPVEMRGGRLEADYARITPENPNGLFGGEDGMARFTDMMTSGRLVGAR